MYRAYPQIVEAQRLQSAACQPVNSRLCPENGARHGTHSPTAAIADPILRGLLSVPRGRATPNTQRGRKGPIIIHGSALKCLTGRLGEKRPVRPEEGETRQEELGVVSESAGRRRPEGLWSALHCA